MIPPFLVPTILALSLPLAAAAPIDLNHPIIQSLTPDILFFNFDEESVEDISDHGPHKFHVTVCYGGVDMPPRTAESRSPVFGRAIDFHYGAFDTSSPDLNPNDLHRGNHLIIGTDPALDLVDQSFTMGGWVKVPDFPPDMFGKWKHALSKGGFRDTFPGWGLYIRYDENQARWFLHLNLVGEYDGDWVSVSAPLDNFEYNRWMHIAASYNQESQEVILYENGTPIHAASVSIRIAASEYDLTIGERGISTQNNLPAVMDEVFITSGVHEFMPAD